MIENLLQIRHISKSFNGNKVLDDISMSVNGGEVLAVLGENGAGKSTLLKIVAATIPKDTGDILLADKPVQMHTPHDAHTYGIWMIHQEGQYFNNFTVAKSFFVGAESRGTKSFFVDYRKLGREIEPLFQSLELGFHAGDMIKDLTMAQRKFMEIARAIYFRVKVLILDEPTLAFSPKDLQVFRRIVARLLSEDVAIIFVSHRIKEVIAIANRAIVLRDGKIVAQEQSGEFNSYRMIEEIAGEYGVNRYPKTKAPKGDVVLEALNIANRTNVIKGVSLRLHGGEILGIAGLQGAGKSTLARLITGLEPISRGDIFVRGKLVHFKSPADAIKHGVAYLGQNTGENLFLDRGLDFNIIISNLRRSSRCGVFINRQAWSEAAARKVGQLGIRVYNQNLPVRYLSGGSRKKVAIAKCLYAYGNVMVFDDPSLELDMATKVELYNIMNAFTHKGGSIVLISSDVHELVGMSDRICVMFDGQISGELDARDASAVSVLNHATGNI